MKPVLLINPNTSQETTAMMVRLLREALPQSLALVSETAARGAPMITTQEALATSELEVQRIGRERAHEVSAIVVAAFGDPGVATLRSELSIPVIGIGEASLREAAEGGRLFGVATTTPGLDQSIASAVRKHGLDTLCTGTRIPPGDPLALAASPELQEARLAEAVQQCIDDGAAAVVIGGGPLAEAAGALASRFQVPVISAVAAAARSAERQLAPVLLSR